MVVSPIGKSRTTPQSRSDAPALRDSGLHASRESDISPGFRSSSGADLAKCGRWGAFRKLRLPHRSHLALLCAAGRSRRSASTRTGIPASPPSQTAPGLPAEDVPTHAKNAFGDAATPKRPFSFASSLTLASITISLRPGVPLAGFPPSCLSHAPSFPLGRARGFMSNAACSRFCPSVPSSGRCATPLDIKPSCAIRGRSTPSRKED